MGLLTSLADHVTDEVEGAIKRALAPVAPYLRKLSIGTVLVLLSVTGFSLTLLALAAALFLAIAGYAALSVAALWTALAMFVAGLLLVLSGVMAIRRPH